MKGIFGAILATVGVIFLALPGICDAGEASAALQYGKLPLSFVENRGQLDEGVKYVIRGPRGSAFFTNAGVTFDLWETQGEQLDMGNGVVGPTLLSGNAGQDSQKTETCKRAVVKVGFLDADPKCAAQGIDELPGKVNYLIGSDQSKWHTDIPTYKGVIYRNVWPGIDAIYRGDSNRLKYDIRVSPGADLSLIRLRYEGADSLSLDENGELRVATAVADFRENVPGIYQEKDGEKIQLEGGYVLLDANTVGFRIEGYDPSLPLVIDPASDLIYSTFLGGMCDDAINGIAVDAYGCAYVVGSTSSSDFPTTPGAFDTSFNGSIDYRDAFVTKLNSSGSALVYSTFLGGTLYDYTGEVAVDASGCAYVAGETGSSDFPTTPGAFDTSYCGGYSDGFVAKLNSSGDALIYSTFLGGTSSDCALAIAADDSGRVYVAGYTKSSNFPTTPGAFDASHNGGSNFGDAFITKLNSSGAALVYSTFLGGTSDDWARAIAVDGSGCAYVVGGTISSDFPTTPYAFDTSYGGGYSDGFVAKLNSSGSSLCYSIFLGGTNTDYADAITIDSSGCAYMVGMTNSSNFPTTLGTFDTSYNGGVSDAFVTKLNTSGTALVYSAFLGGTNIDEAEAITVDNSGCVFVAGYTYSSDFPTTPGAFDTSFNGSTDYRDAFVTKLNSSGSALVYSTFLGGTSNDCAAAIAADGSGRAYVAGYTYSSDFPTTPGAFDRSYNGGYNHFDAFVSKLWTPPVLVLRVYPEGSGTTSPPVGDYGYLDNITVVSLSATPSPGYVFDHWQGDVADPTSSSTTVLMDISKLATAVFVSVANAAKQKADDTTFAGNGSIVSAAFTDFFYIESDTRECGIRVDKPGHDLEEDMRADVEGTVRTNADGERYIDADVAVQSSLPYATGHVDPLGMTNKSLGGGDWLYQAGAEWPITLSGQKGVKGGFGLNNIGLLVRVAGRVVEIGPIVKPSKTPTWFKIKDGSGVSVKCLVPSTVTINPSWTFVAVTGVSSCEKIGDDLQRLIRVRKQEDITPY